MVWPNGPEMVLHLLSRPSTLGYYDLHLYGGFFEAISQLAVEHMQQDLAS
jgi:hypothetical protein